VGITLHFAALRNEGFHRGEELHIRWNRGIRSIICPVDNLWGGFISADFSLAARPFVTVVFLLNKKTS
jgi:hypothetical protein